MSEGGVRGLAAPALRRYLPPFLPEVAHWGGAKPDILVTQPGDLRWASRRAPQAKRLVAEDGLIRSVGDAGTGAPPLSLILQDTADLARGRTTLDALLSDPSWANEALLAEARDLMAFKQAEGLARTNAALPAADLQALGRPRVLVVDRSPDDGFLGARPPPPAAFDAMLHCARTESPGAFLIVLRFPGCAGLSGAALALADAVLVDVDVADLMGRVDQVHTLTGLVGLEAVLAGVPVTCHSAPFYAGLGFTDDRALMPPRGALDRETLFAAAYLKAPRYVDPLTGSACGPRQAFERLAAFKRHARRVAGNWRPVNIRAFKQGVMKAFLAGPSSRYPARRDAPAARKAVWATGSDAPARRAGDGLARVEDGFVRSIGLGSAFAPAGSIVLDVSGIHFDPRRPSDLERLLLENAFDDPMLRRARRLREALVAGAVTKYNLAPEPPPIRRPAGKSVVFVPGQVEDDAAVALAGRGMTNLALLERVRAERPEAHIVYKEHPDVSAGNRVGRIADVEALRFADQVLRHADVLACIGAADEVHTLASLAGFEALLRDKPVVTYGWPFYAGWGLTTDLDPWPNSPREPRSLEALIAAALILYPLYLDPVTALPCDALTFVQRVREAREAAPPRRPRGRILRLIRAVQVMVRPPPARPY